MSDDLHPDFDPERWLTAEGYEGRLFLGYQPHTHIGRIGVWSSSLGRGFGIDLNEILEMSPISRVWIDGYLTGSEPGPGHMFGSDVDDLPDGHSRLQRWRKVRDHYRATGEWTGGYWVDVVPLGDEAALPAWTLRGDEIWSWDGHEWSFTEVDPGPHGTLQREPCRSRGGHEMDLIDDEHTQCEDCGYVS